MINYKLHFGRYNKKGKLKESRVANVTLEPNHNVSFKDLEKSILSQLGPDWIMISKDTVH